MRDPMRLVRLVIIIGMCSGCTTVDYAVYKHPVTGNELACEHQPTIFSFGPDAYANCKTSLERLGYVRTGTVQRAGSDKDPVEAERPRPLPSK